MSTSNEKHLSAAREMAGAALGLHPRWAEAEVDANPQRYLDAARVAYRIGDWKAACRLTFRLGSVLGRTARWSEWERALDFAADAAVRLDDPIWQARVDTGLGRLRSDQGRHLDAIACAIRAQSGYEQAGDWLWVAIQLWVRAEAERSLCRWNDADKHYREAHRILMRLPDTSVGRRERARWQVIQLRGLGDLDRELWKWASALARFDQALIWFAKLDEPGWVAWTRRARAGVLRRCGEYDAALRELEAPEHFFRREGNRRALTLTLHERAVVNRDAGALQTASGLLDRCITVFRELGGRTMLADSVRARGVTYRLAGDLKDSRRALSSARQIYLEVGDRRWAARALANLGQTAAAAGSADEAVMCWAGALDEVQGLDVPEEIRLHQWIASPERWADPGDGDRPG
jgi:tetratricopeptide (TPR) repeat protein